MKKAIYFSLVISLMLIIILTGCLPKKERKIINEKPSSEEQAKVNQVENKEPPEEFCGWSTKEVCEIDLDCAVGGCSGQVCMAQGEDIITTCEMKNCYEASQYGITCQCANQECKWQKENKI